MSLLAGIMEPCTGEQIATYFTRYHLYLHKIALSIKSLQHMCPKFGMKYTDEDFAEATKTHQSTLRMMEEHFLKDTKFIHSDQISIADLLAVCEFTQFWMTDEKDVMSGRPKITQWLANVQSALSPYFDEVHEMVFDHKKLGTFCSGSQ